MDILLQTFTNLIHHFIKKKLIIFYLLVLIFIYIQLYYIYSDILNYISEKKRFKIALNETMLFNR